MKTHAPAATRSRPSSPRLSGPESAGPWRGAAPTIRERLAGPVVRRDPREDAGNAVEQELGYWEHLARLAAEEAIAELQAACASFPAPACPNADCPPCFCSPLPLSRDEILIFREMVATVVLPGIAAKVSPRVVPLWYTYIFGGSGVQDLSGTFGADFMLSQTTLATNARVRAALEASINPRATLPAAIDVPSRIPAFLREMNTDGHAHAMDFNVIGEIPGNIAGGIGANQTACAAGAQPSPLDDSRSLEGSATLSRLSPDSVLVVPDLTYVVEDTIDLCPGNCGAQIEQVATLPLSWLEASGVSGDVPFRVRFPALLPPFVVDA
jgi:hypothetical protein